MGVSLSGLCQHSQMQNLSKLSGGSFLFLEYCSYSAISREHRGKVTSADVSDNGKFALTTSGDGKKCKF